MDRVIDRVNDLNTDAPKILVHANQPVSPELIFGLDTKLFELQGSMAPDNKNLQEEIDQHGNKTHHKNELDTMEVKCFSDRNNTSGQLGLDKFEKFLGTLDKEDVYRLKGFVRLSGIKEEGTDETSSSVCVVNHAFGKWTIIPVPDKQDLEPADETTSPTHHNHDHDHDHDHNHEHDHDHDHDHNHTHPHNAGQKNVDRVLQLHFILMGELWSIKHKLVYGCGSEYPSGSVLCEFKSRRETIEWDKPLPATYNEFVAEQRASKQ